MHCNFKIFSYKKFTEKKVSTKIFLDVKSHPLLQNKTYSILLSIIIVPFRISTPLQTCFFFINKHPYSDKCLYFYNITVLPEYVSMEVHLRYFVHTHNATLRKQSLGSASAFLYYDVHVNAEFPKRKDLLFKFCFAHLTVSQKRSKHPVSNRHPPLRYEK